MRHSKLHTGNSGAHEQIEVVQRTRTDAHQDLVGFDFWIGNVFVYQYFRRAVLMDAGGFHPSQYSGPLPKSSRTAGFTFRLPRNIVSRIRFKISSRRYHETQDFDYLRAVPECSADPCCWLCGSKGTESQAGATERDGPYDQ